MVVCPLPVALMSVAVMIALVLVSWVVVPMIALALAVASRVQVVMPGRLEIWSLRVAVGVQHTGVA